MSDKNAATTRVLRAINANEDGIRDEIAGELHDLDLLSEERHLVPNRIRRIFDAWSGVGVTTWVIDIVDQALDSVDWQAVADQCVEEYMDHRWEGAA